MSEEQEREAVPDLAVSVDKTKCCGFGNCWASAPEIFEVGDDGLAFTTRETVPGDLAQKVHYAQERCPQDAIDVRET